MIEDIAEKHSFLKKVKVIDGKQKLSMRELFSIQFLTANTRFTSMEDFIEKSGHSVTSQHDFERIPREELDRVVKKYSGYSTLQDMTNAALELWLEQNLSAGGGNP